MIHRSETYRKEFRHPAPKHRRKHQHQQHPCPPTSCSRFALTHTVSLQGAKRTFPAPAGPMIMAPNLLMIAAVDLPEYVNSCCVQVFVIATLDASTAWLKFGARERKKKIMTELFPRAAAPLLLSTSSYLFSGPPGTRWGPDMEARCAPAFFGDKTRLRKAGLRDIECVYPCVRSFSSNLARNSTCKPAI